MTAKPKRWLLNLKTGTLHDRWNFTESCNTDDIDPRYRFLSGDIEEVMSMPAFAHRCRHCAKAARTRYRVVANPDAAAAS